MKILYANRITPDKTPQNAASYPGLFCLPMSHKRDISENSIGALKTSKLLQTNAVLGESLIFQTGLQMPTASY